MVPAINWRMYDTESAGTFCTATLLATQVVPQMMHVAANAKYALVFLLFLICSFSTINCFSQNYYFFKILINYTKNSVALMFKMPCTCNYHGKIILYAIINTVFISYRTARLNKCFDARCMGNLHTIIKGKEGIACKGSTF